MRIVFDQSRVEAVRHFKSWLGWVFERDNPILGNDTVRYAIKRGQDLMLTEEEMAPMHNYLAKRAL